MISFPKCDPALAQTQGKGRKLSTVIHKYDTEPEVS